MFTKLGHANLLSIVSLFYENNVFDMYLKSDLDVFFINLTFCDYIVHVNVAIFKALNLTLDYYNIYKGKY